MDIKALIYVGAGGAAGSICRYVVGYFMSKRVNTAFPLATLSVNLLGSLIIGLLFGFSIRHSNQLSQNGGMLLLATGFCGGFTTFSAFSLESINLIRGAQSSLALLYIGVSIVAGLLLCRFGIYLAS